MITRQVNNVSTTVATVGKSILASPHREFFAVFFEIYVLLSHNCSPHP